MMVLRIHQSLVENSSWIQEIEKIKDYEINIDTEYTIHSSSLQYKNAVISYELVIKFVTNYIYKILERKDIRHSKLKIERFIKSTFTHLTCHPLSNIIAIFYFEKVIDKILDKITRTRIIIKYIGILIMLSSKMWEDSVYSNYVFLYDFDLYKKITEKEWLKLEKEVLEMLDYELYLSEHDFITFIQKYSSFK